MRITLSNLFKYSDSVFIFNCKYYNEIISNSGLTYSMCGAGVHLNGIVDILFTNKNKYVICDFDILKIVDNSQIVNLISSKKIVPYSKKQYEDAIIRRKANSINKKNNSIAKIERKKQFISELEQGIKRSLSLKHWVERTEIELKNKSTKYEQIVFDKLPKSLKKNAVRQKPISVNGKYYFIDIYIKRKKIAIEVDGEYHASQAEKDKKRDDDLMSKGIKTVRILNSEVLDNSFHKKLKHI